VRERVGGGESVTNTGGESDGGESRAYQVSCLCVCVCVCLCVSVWCFRWCA
jgi:hypothetical protein